MTKFSELGIKSESNAYTGDKIKIDKILNTEIKVLKFKIEESQFKGECLYLQIEYKGEHRVLFTGSKNLIKMIRKVPDEKFPIETIIVKDNETLEFT